MVSNQTQHLKAYMVGRLTTSSSRKRSYNANSASRVVARLCATSLTSMVGYGIFSTEVLPTMMEKVEFTKEDRGDKEKDDRNIIIYNNSQIKFSKLLIIIIF